MLGGNQNIVEQPGFQFSRETTQRGTLPHCPRGLEYLNSVDQLFVKQKVVFLTNNKYAIKNARGQDVYYAIEDSDCCNRSCFGKEREFDMKIFDNMRNEVIHLYRPFACSCCLCCLQSLEVSAPPGNLIGTIEQEWTFWKPSFLVKDQSGETILRIEGPFCTMSCCSNVDFNVKTLNGQEIGQISKLDRDYNKFGISFPIDLDVKMKATILGALFLINAMFYDGSSY